LNVEVVQAQNSEELYDKVAKSVTEDVRKERENLPFPASLVTPVEKNVLMAFAEPKLFGEEKGVRCYMYEFKAGSVTPITGSSRSFLSKYRTIMLLAVGLLVLASVLRFMRWRRQRGSSADG